MKCVKVVIDTKLWSKKEHACPFVYKLKEPKYKESENEFVTRRVPPIKQVLFTFPEHLSLPPVFSGFVLFNLYISVQCFAYHCLSFCPLFLVIVLSFLLRFTASDYPSGTELMIPSWTNSTPLEVSTQCYPSGTERMIPSCTNSTSLEVSTLCQ